MRVWIPKINIFALNVNQFLKLNLIKTSVVVLWTDNQHAASLFNWVIQDKMNTQK
jgi:hypothetical protein